MSELVEQQELIDVVAYESMSLDELADGIASGHESVKLKVRRTAGDVARVGAMLTIAKGKCEHGEWLPWLAEKCPEISRRTAYHYLQVYRKIWDGPNLQLIANLTPTQAYKALGVVKELGLSLSKEDDVPEDLPEPSIHTEVGGIYRLGEHILYCGDSSNPDFISSCQKREIAFAFADPPYNSTDVEWDRDFIWNHDYLSSVAPVVAVTPGISNIQSFMRATEMPYKWAISSYINNGMTRGAIGFGNWIFVALFSDGALYQNAQDHYEVPIKASDKDPFKHKGRKPMGMLRILVDLFTDEGDTVLDPFLGSGTTLLVAEELRRKCIGAEISPEYCDAIIARWEDATGGRVG